MYSRYLEDSEKCQRILSCGRLDIPNKRASYEGKGAQALTFSVVTLETPNAPNLPVLVHREELQPGGTLSCRGRMVSRYLRTVLSEPS